MTQEKLIDAITDLDSDILNRYFDMKADLASKKKPRKRTWVKWVSVAACFALIIAVALPILNNITTPNPIVNGDNIYGVVNNIDNSMQYMTLEELCLHANEVVSARYLGGTIENGVCKLEFVIIERHKGVGNETSLHLTYQPSDNHIYDDYVFAPFEKGETYLLLLEKKSQTVYDKTDLYSFVSSQLVLSISNIANCSLYGESLEKHMKSSNISAPQTTDQLINYILECSKNVPDEKSSELIYIQSTDLNAVISGSDYVVKATVGNCRFTGSDGRVTHYCTIESSYKGDLKVATEIEVLFPKDAVAIGDSFILIVNKFTNTASSFILTSDNSIIDVSQEEIIIEIIN